MGDLLIPKLPVSKAINELANIYVPLINKNLPFSIIPSPFFWGPPGVGKSDGVNELAQILSERTGKKVKVTDIRLLLFSPIDLRGVPVADETRTFTDWLKPRILDLDASEDTVNILFLDELSAAPQSVQAAAYQITLNRAIGEHRLPDNTIVMAAGNRTTDRSVAFKMPSALANRMMHYEIAVDYKSWAQWAVNEGNVHPLVLGYIAYATNKLYVEERGIDEVAFPTPRSWMFVSNILNTIGDVSDIAAYHAVIAGCIGSGTAIEFVGWSKIWRELPAMKDIVEGKKVTVRKTPDILYALCASLITYISGVEKNHDGLSLSEYENISGFCATLPADYSNMVFLNIVENTSVRNKLMKCHNFLDWAKKYGRNFM